MSILLQIVFFSLFAGAPLVVGGIVARSLTIRDRVLREAVLHWIVAFGGGVLLSAVAFALVPYAIKTVSLIVLVLSFTLGTLSFVIVHYVLGKFSHPYTQVIAMVSDFIPEALVLGASFAIDPAFGLLLAFFIGLQNLPEGFNAYRELRVTHSGPISLGILAIFALFGVLATLMGSLYLTSNALLISVMLLFASGGIVYLTFQDIAPASKIDGHRVAATGAAFGFLLGMMAEFVLG